MRKTWWIPGGPGQGRRSLVIPLTCRNKLRRADGEWLAGLLTDLEVDEVARLRRADALRRTLA